MNAVRMVMAVVIVLVAGSVLAVAGSQQSFDAMKSLNGIWEGQGKDGKPLQVSFKVTAGGSALMSEIHGMDEDMITMFHPDGDRLLMTHYCAAGNQPRMQGTASPDGKTIMFNFIDGTNITALQLGHMEKLVVTMLDPSHHTEEWSFKGADGKEMKEAFDLHRK